MDFVSVPFLLVINQLWFYLFQLIHKLNLFHGLTIFLSLHVELNRVYFFLLFISLLWLVRIGILYFQFFNLKIFHRFYLCSLLPEFLLMILPLQLKLWFCVVIYFYFFLYLIMLVKLLGWRDLNLFFHSYEFIILNFLPHHLPEHVSTWLIPSLFGFLIHLISGIMTTSFGFLRWWNNLLWFKFGLCNCTYARFLNFILILALWLFYTWIVVHTNIIFSFCTEHIGQSFILRVDNVLWFSKI